MAATVRYVDGTAAVFASRDEALAQAVHDQTQPGHVAPFAIVDGDHGGDQASWGTAIPVPLVYSVADLRSRQCQCVDCQYQLRAPAFGVDGGAGRMALLQGLQHDREQGKRP